MLKTFFIRYKKFYIWLLCVLAVLAFFHVFKNSRPVMNFIAQFYTEPLKRALGTLYSFVPFSMAELSVAATIFALVIFSVTLIAKLIFRRRGRIRILYTRLMTLLCAILSVYAAFCLFWGVNYYTDSFCERAGITSGDGVSTEQLTRVTARFAAELNRLSDSIERTDTGAFNAARDTIYDDAVNIYRGIEELYPFLKMRDHKPKRIFFSKWMSRSNFTGVFFPFSGEANLNDHSPACMLPATIAHEMAHQRGVASEQECNFIAVLVCEKSGIPSYEYSGALLAFIHLSNALHRADPDTWNAIHQTLNSSVRADLKVNNEYWAQYESKTAEVSQDVYDNFLKSYGEESGIKSYGEVVDLLVAYYDETAQD